MKALIYCSHPLLNIGLRAGELIPETRMARAVVSSASIAANKGGGVSEIDAAKAAKST